MEKPDRKGSGAFKADVEFSDGTRQVSRSSLTYGADWVLLCEKERGVKARKTGRLSSKKQPAYRADSGNASAKKRTGQRSSVESTLSFLVPSEKPTKAM